MRKPKTAETPEAPKPEPQSAPLAWIDVPEDRARYFDPEEAAGLAAMIAATGLQHPIRVRIVGNRYRLVAGRKRLEAARLLGWEAIPTTISNAANDDEARIEEVTENLARPKLVKLDRYHHLYELKVAYERLHPQTKHGAKRGNQYTIGKMPNWHLSNEDDEIFGFATAMAEKIGMSRRSIARAVEIWTGLTEASRKRCAGTWLADHQSGLKELSEQSPVAQAAILDLLFSDPPAASTVKDAATIFRSGVVQTPAEKKIESVKRGLNSLPETAASGIVSAHANDPRLADLQQGIDILSKYFGKLEDAELDKVVQQHEARIIASLQRRGVI